MIELHTFTIDRDRVKIGTKSECINLSYIFGISTLRSMINLM
jgi:hypothetical protein